MEPSFQHGQALGENYNTRTPDINPPGQTPATAKPFWTIEHYAQYFDVDTDQVLKRMMFSFIPNDAFLNTISGNPDLYGPFWISTTIVFLLFVTSSLALSISAYLSSKDYSYDFTVLPLAASSVYSYTFGLPLILWGICKYYSKSVKIMELWNVYGYSLTVWVPVSLLCIIPFEFMRYIFVILAFAISSIFQLKNLSYLLLNPTQSQYSVTSPLSKRATNLVLAVVLIFNATLALIFKIRFFSYVVEGM
ncbi:hypothetical protein BKA69DRAFT_1050610 [Paraphysoderma sedebokerense]|nr:hypothetical protein BKA69DRAFT_1050610 [Paraphysoderma sedebokerense]